MLGASSSRATSRERPSSVSGTRLDGREERPLREATAFTSRRGLLCGLQPPSRNDHWGVQAQSAASAPLAPTEGAQVPSAAFVQALVSPPVALTLHVVAPGLAETGRADDDDLEALRPGLVASPCTGGDAHRIPLLELDDLVVELHPPAPAHDHVHLLLPLVRVAVGKAITGRDALKAQAGLLELERIRGHAELQVRRAVEVGPDILEILLEVPERERHGQDSTVQSPPRRRP